MIDTEQSIRRGGTTMPELDGDQRRAMHFLEGIAKEAIFSWFQTSGIGRTALKALGRDVKALEALRRDQIQEDC